MSRKARVVIGLLMLIVSISLLIWGFRPLKREIRTQPILPADLELPTPISLLIDTSAVS